MTEATPPAVELDLLLALFYSDSAVLGTFTPCARAACPAVYRRMLAHQSHMTVTVEKRHGCLVDVEVLATGGTNTHYSRKILLRRQSDRRVVQFGIVRLALNALQPDVRDEILQQLIPLGRVLIQHKVMRKVQLLELLQVTCGKDLADAFEVPLGSLTYGRTALIYCDGEPAVELLEIIAPEVTGS